MGRESCLPEFIVIGAQKSGTTSVFSYLGEHPCLVPSSRKEVHFFDGGINPKIDNFKKGIEWYKTHFPTKEDAKDRKAFEVSPLYMLNPLSYKRIFELMPEVKLIAVLRNPTERAISHYFHERRQGLEPLPILEALCAEEERLKDTIEREDFKSYQYIHYSYKSRGMYYDQLEKYYNVFSANNILVLDSEVLFMAPREALRRICEFVGIDPEYKFANLKPVNVGKNRADVDPEVYDYLDSYFCPHNKELYELIGQDFAW